MKNSIRCMINVVLFLSILLFWGCSKTNVDNNYKALIDQSIKEIEISINKNDLKRFSNQIASAEVAEDFKGLVGITEIFENNNSKSNIVTLIPVKYEINGNDVNVEVVFEYKGKITKKNSYTGIGLVDNYMKETTKKNAPNSATFEYKKIENNYKLNKITFGGTYGLMTDIYKKTLSYIRRYADKIISFL